MADAPPPPAASRAARGGPPLPPPPMLPVPALTPVLFATLFADADRDPTNGDPGRLLSPFVNDLTNPAANTATAELQNALAQSGNERQLLAATIIAGGRARSYVCPFRWEDGLTTNNPTLNNKYFAIAGELVWNQGHVVEFERAVFDLLHNQVAVPTPATIAAAFAADATATQMRLYTAADDTDDAGTELVKVKTRRIMPAPHFLVDAWLAEGDGIKGARFWRGCITPSSSPPGMRRRVKPLSIFSSGHYRPTWGSTGGSVVARHNAPSAPPQE